MKLNLPKSWKAPFRIEPCLEGSLTCFVFDANDKCVLSDLSQEEARSLRDLFNTVAYEENFMTWRDMFVANVKKIIPLYIGTHIVNTKTINNLRHHLEENAKTVIDMAIHRRGWLPTPNIDIYHSNECPSTISVSAMVDNVDLLQEHPWFRNVIIAENQFR